jgi:hypothetical protein
MLLIVPSCSAAVDFNERAPSSQRTSLSNLCAISHNPAAHRFAQENERWLLYKLTLTFFPADVRAWVRFSFVAVKSKISR